MFVTYKRFESSSSDNFFKGLKEHYLACNSSLVQEDCGGVCVEVVLNGPITRKRVRPF